MVGELVSSFQENIKQKSRNPILGTYLIVWLIRNWDLIYSLFNFDSQTQLKSKVQFIFNYYSNVNFGVELIYNFGYSILILIGSFILLNLSRLIINFFETTVTPWVYKKSDKSSIVLKSDFERQTIKIRDLVSRLNEIQYQKTELEIKNIELRVELDKYLGTSVLDSETQISTKSLQGFNKTSVDLVKKNQLEAILDLLNSKNLIDSFIQTSILIRKQEEIKDSRAIDEFIALNLITLKRKDAYNPKVSYYDLTYIGDKVVESIKLVSSL